MIYQALETLPTETGFFSTLPTTAPLVTGIIAIVWLLWRLFWKVDRRSQQEVLNQDKKIKKLETDIESERRQRFDSDLAKARLSARETSLETQISELTEQVSRLKEEIVRLRAQISGNTGSNHS